MIQKLKILVHPVSSNIYEYGVADEAHIIIYRFK